MAEERNSENFALGLIVAAIIWLLLRSELGAKGFLGSGKSGAGGAGGAGGSGSGAFGGGSGSGIPGSSGGGCGCGGASSASPYPTNPGISIGGQSLGTKGTGFGSSSVHTQVTESGFGNGPGFYESAN